MRIKSLLMTGFVACSALHAAIADPVRIDTGLISGVAGNAPEVRAFKGVPFAAPPVGDLRWRAPQPAAKWDGVRKADKFGAACMQVATPHADELPFNEDCLYLNLWTAAQSASDRRPVMMWIYGGGMLVGNGGRPSFFGDELAKKGVIVVTINYRVGLMGSFVHPELSKESGHNASGNQAVSDMVAALQWIHRNIAAFGGDPGNVTIFGQSSGAGSVSHLLGSPLAKGLFQRAICESSGSFQIGRRTSTDLATAEKNGLQFQAKAGAKSLADLRAMPAADLIKMSWNTRHNLDGWVQPDDLDAIFAAGKQNDVPILAGSNSDEGANVVTNPLSAAKWVESVKRQYGSMADGYLKLYPGDNDKQAEQSQRNEARDLRAWMARTILRMENNTGKSKTYSYFFSRNPAGVVDPANEYPLLAKPGAAHASEIVYVFENLSSANRPWKDWDRQLSDTMSSYWVNFAKTGDPNGANLAKWPVYDAGQDLLMHFGDKVAVEAPPLKKAIDAADPYFSAPKK